MGSGIVQERVVDALTRSIRRAKSKGQLKADVTPVVTIGAPKRPEWGDLATTVAMAMASSEQRSPRDIAEILLDNLDQQDALFDRLEIASPGFINLTIRRPVWLEVLKEIEAQSSTYGYSTIGQGRRVLVEYVSANPTGPLHVGHGRGAAIGQALVRLLRAVGYDATSEYYINDAGRQMKLLGESVYAQYQGLHGRRADVPSDGYQGAYVRTVAEHITQQVGATLLDLPQKEAYQRSQELAYKELLGMIQADLDAFGIRFDSWFSEAALVESGAVGEVLNQLKARGVLFQENGAWWFRSSQFGDEKDRVVRKQDGEYTYLASDMVYHRDKLNRGYDTLIDVWGADHHGYIPRMQALVQAYGHPKECLRVVLVQMVNLLRGGKKVEMSKRAGEFITLREVIDEVGADAAKFFFLMRDATTHLDFDLELAKQQSRENPVYYVQYAHARIASLWRVAESRGIPCSKPSEAALDLLQDPEEFGLIKKLSVYPSVLESSANALEPHRLTYYLQELAGMLHGFYNRHRILPSAEEVAGQRDAEESAEPCSSRGHEMLTPALTGARLALMWVVQQVLRNGLGVLGISAPEQM